MCLCTGRGLATSWLPVQGVLPTILDLVNEVKRKVSWRRPRPELGCRAKRKRKELFTYWISLNAKFFTYIWKVPSSNLGRTPTFLPEILFGHPRALQQNFHVLCWSTHASIASPSTLAVSLNTIILLSHHSTMNNHCSWRTIANVFRLGAVDKLMCYVKKKFSYWKLAVQLYVVEQDVES
jgi:hypothetical protein